MILLRESGVISTFLQYIGLIDGPIEFLYTDATIMLGLVYSEHVVYGSAININLRQSR
ncbi:hypothetical protein ACLKMH_12775 [Psychromonas sp. KJ10-10]|uniref:hypothetical protein n=1 Tax=Psychromonas sp. KJ10-10 TaxID=3391823 RepID=UPI0039B44FFD